MFWKNVFESSKRQVLILQIFQNWFDSIPSLKSKVINKTVKNTKEKRLKKKEARPNWAKSQPSLPASPRSASRPAQQPTRD